MHQRLYRYIVAFVAFLFASVFAGGLEVSAADRHDESSEKPLDVKEILFEHLGDGYGWEMPFDHHKRIPLPVIVRSNDGSWHVFSSGRVTGGNDFVDGGVKFRIAKDGEYRNKIVEVDGAGVETRVTDVSITKNVCAIFITMLVIMSLCFWLKSWYRRNGYRVPRRGLGVFEALIEFIYSGVIKSTLKDRADKFAPYLLTVFMFIFVLNIMGLMVVFPGGANVTGNIAVTMVLAVFTFFFTNIFGTKHYWKEILWPDVPLWLKFPIPIMQVIEIFGMFTKPAALTVRLFANMMGGHMIVLVLTLLIFIFASFGPVVVGATSVVSIAFSVFMLLVDVLVSFIQAYVFTMLSTIFIALAQEGGHEGKHERNEDNGGGAKDAAPVSTL
ncbi:MAG: F0F1 ATP synthase subunit A [Muribaculaceae bacterium]|nr:F0F1 ATP synthase subunit A [Muribaculaceae bacterium]